MMELTCKQQQELDVALEQLVKDVIEQASTYPEEAHRHVEDFFEKDGNLNISSLYDDFAKYVTGTGRYFS